MKTNWLKRVFKAPARYRTCRGFGVHSPFAYTFITRVLREKLPYYAYDVQKNRYKAALADAGRHPFLTPKRIRLLFRTVNYFSPESVLQIGSDNGLVTSALLDVNSEMRITRCMCSDVYEAENVTVVNIPDTMDSGNLPNIVIIVTADDTAQMRRLLEAAVEQETVVIFPCVDHNDDIYSLWQHANSVLNSYGMTFTNDRYGVIVASRKYPRQKYSLWL